MACEATLTLLPFAANVKGAFIMQRITLLLPPDLKAQAQRQARAQGVSLGELIREILATTLKTEPNGQRAADPLFADDAVFLGDTPSDLSLHHDCYLYEDPHSS